MTNNWTDQDILNKDILELIGAQNLPDDKKKQLYQKMLETIQNRSITRILDQLSDNDAEEFKTILDSGDQPKADQFLKSKGIDIRQIMLQESIIYKTEMTELSKQIKPSEENQ